MGRKIGKREDAKRAAELKDYTSKALVNVWRADGENMCPKTLSVIQDNPYVWDYLTDDERWDLYVNHFVYSNGFSFVRHYRCVKILIERVCRCDWEYESVRMRDGWYYAARNEIIQRADSGEYFDEEIMQYIKVCLNDMERLSDKIYHIYGYKCVQGIFSELKNQFWTPDTHLIRGHDKWRELIVMSNDNRLYMPSNDAYDCISAVLERYIYYSASDAYDALEIMKYVMSYSNGKYAEYVNVECILDKLINHRTYRYLHGNEKQFLPLAYEVDPDWAIDNGYDSNSLSA